MRLYIIRHADPDYPNQTITAVGHLEAQALARRLAGHGLDRIFTSPLGRVLHTMQYTSNLLKLPYQIENWLREISEFRVDSETWGSLAAWDIPGEVYQAAEPPPSVENWTHIPPLDQPLFATYLDQLRQNSDAFLHQLGYQREGRRYRILQSNREQIAIFCHNGFGLTWLAHLLSIPLPVMWSSFWLPPSSVSTVLFEERSLNWAVPRCLGMADVSHLYEARLPVQPHGLKANQG